MAEPRYDVVWTRPPTPGDEGGPYSCHDLTADQVARRLMAAVTNYGPIEVKRMHRRVRGAGNG